MAVQTFVRIRARRIITASGEVIDPKDPEKEFWAWRRDYTPTPLYSVDGTLTAWMGDPRATSPTRILGPTESSRDCCAEVYYRAQFSGRFWRFSRKPLQRRRFGVRC